MKQFVGGYPRFEYVVADVANSHAPQNLLRRLGMGPRTPGDEKGSLSVWVKSPCRAENLRSSLIGKRVVHQDNGNSLLAGLGPPESPHGVFGSQLTTDPEISTERALQLALDPSQLTRIRVDRQ